MHSTPLHVIVIGGGIGGLCLAQALKAVGVGVAVYERNPIAAWPEGYRIHINPIGSRALHACLPAALWDVFIATAGTPPTGLGFLTEQLEELVVIGKEFMANKAGDPINAHYPVNRIALRQVLLAGMQDVIQFDKVFERYEQHADGTVTAFFTDGASASGDVLVAADGANSKVRKQFLPYAQRIEIGAAGIGGKLLLTEQTRAWLPRQLSTRMNLTSFNPFKTMAPIAPWASINITLLGDAIHNMPPVGGLGGNLALRDASLLARKLTAAQCGELPLLSAIQEYEAEMRRYSFAAVSAVLENTRQATSRSRVAREVGKTWFRLCNVVPPLKRAFEERWTRPMRA